MCGIAGVVNLRGQRPVPSIVLQQMAEALFHRGPDEDGFLEQAGVSLASRRLSIVGLADGFGYKTIAEGVEDAETLELLADYGVDFAQGFYLGRPAPIEGA